LVGQPLGLLRNKAEIPPATLLRTFAGDIKAIPKFKKKRIEELREAYLNTHRGRYSDMNDVDKIKFNLVSELRVIARYDVSYCAAKEVTQLFFFLFPQANLHPTGNGFSVYKKNGSIFKRYFTWEACVDDIVNRLENPTKCLRVVWCY
jgi:hypothetical protein